MLNDVWLLSAWACQNESMSFEVFICKHSPVKDSGLLQHVAQVDVGVQEVRVQRDRLLEVMDGEPDLALSVEHAAQVAPCDGEVGTRLDSLKVASLEATRGESRY